MARTAVPTSPSSPRPRVRLAPDARREQILREATRLISESGFNAVSLADIAEACDIRKPSVLHYFGSMNSLLLAVLEGRDAKALNDYQGALLESTGLVVGPEPSAATTRDLVTHVARKNVESRELTRLYSILGAEALAPDHPAHSYFADRARGARSQMEQMFSWKDDPQSAAVEFLSFWQGLELEWLRDPELDFMGTWDTFCDRFFA
jgi:AcrR family transcriptional regulator